jgi:hypothetical protein
MLAVLDVQRVCGRTWMGAAVLGLALCACSSQTAANAAGGGAGDTTGVGGSDSDGTGSGGDSTSGDGGAEVGPIIVHFVPGAVVSTVAGSASAGHADGQGSAATFDNPVNLALGADGNLRVADYNNGMIRLVTPGGAVSTLTAQTHFARPFGATFDAAGTLLVETDWSSTGQNFTGAGTIWSVATASGSASVVVGNVGKPRGLKGLSTGLVAVSDMVEHTVRLLDPTTHAITNLAGKSGVPGNVDGHGADARFNWPYGVAEMADGSLVVADRANHRLRRVTMSGDVTPFAGDGTPGMIDGPAATARFDYPQGVAIDSAGNVYVSDTGNNRIRRIDPTGVVETVAGDGTRAFRDGDGDQAEFFGAEGLDVTSDGKTIYVADGNGGGTELFNRVRAITMP